MALTKVQIDGVEFSDSTDLNVDNGTLFVDSTNNRVGVGTTSAAGQLSCTSDFVFGNQSSTGTGGTGRILATGGEVYIQGGLAATSGSAAPIVFTSYGGVGERARFDASGRLGIGTSSPDSTLELASGPPSFKLTRDTTASTGNDFGRILFENSAGTTLGSIRGYSESDNTDLGLKFSTGTNDTIALTIDEAQRVGIGTTSPNNLLSLAAASGGAYTEVAASGYTLGTNSIYYGQESTGDFVLYNRGNNHLQFGTNNTERARIDSSGRLLVGTSSNFARGNLQVVDGGAGEILVARDDTSVDSGNDLGHLFFGANDGGTGYTVGNVSMYADGAHSSTSHPSRLVFLTVPSGSTSALERMRINNVGTILTTSTGGCLDAGTTLAASTSYYVYRGRHSATAGSPGTGTVSFTVLSNGNVQNTNNSYGAISDIKLKENIVDAASQWDDLKSIQVRNYNFKEETGQQTHTQLGVVAQEVELVSPGLVTESPDIDAEGNDLGTVTKSVNYSVLYMKAVKALQEAMERIETLEAKVAALEAS